MFDVTFGNYWFSIPEKIETKKGVKKSKNVMVQVNFWVIHYNTKKLRTLKFVIFKRYFFLKRCEILKRRILILDLSFRVHNKSIVLLFCCLPPCCVWEWTILVAEK